MKAADIHCPICGYYCLGRGGVGCIDKPGLYFREEAETMPSPEVESGTCARCGKPAPLQRVVCDACQQIADSFNAAIRKVADPGTEPTR